MKSIVLTGFMGTGKTTVGRRLASRLGYRFVDMDDLIEKEAGMKVKEIFSRLGEPHFRALEKDVVKGLCSGSFGRNLVVAAGGGAVVDAGNRGLLRQWALVVCLKASVEAILKRVSNNDMRPLLSKGDRREAVERLLGEREKAYGDCDLMVDTTGMNVDEAVRVIEEFAADKG